MQKNKNVNGEIAELILRAQCGSDGGKKIINLVDTKKSIRDSYAGYAAKDRFVKTAIEMISRNKSDFQYAVTRDHQGIAYYIVYFQTKVDGEKVQTSFHSFDTSLGKYTKNSFRIKWDKKSSREAAVKMYIQYNPNGKYCNETRLKLEESGGILIRSNRY